MRKLVEYVEELIADVFALPPCGIHHRRRCVIRFIFGVVIVYLLVNGIRGPTP